MAIRLPILAKGLVLIAVPLLFQLGFLGLMARMRRDGALAEQWTIHSKDVIAQAQRGRIRLLATIGAAQGFALTGDPSFQSAALDSLAKVPGEFQSLASLVVDNPRQSRSSARLRDDVAVLLGSITEGLAISGPGRIDAARASLPRRSRGLLERLEGQIDAFLDEEKAINAARHEQLKGSWDTMDRLLIGGGIVSVLCTVLVAVAFARNIGGRIAGLTENTRRLAEGRALAPPIGGADEIARLDRVFHEMAATLEAAALRERDQAGQAGRRAEELAEVNAQLREKAQENEMFVYSVSHDLRSPLVNLQGFSKELGLIGKDLSRLVDAPGVPEDVRRRARAMIETEMAESIGFIRTAVTRLGGIIDALLRLSRAGRVEYRHQVVDVGAVVRRAVGALRGTIDERRAVVAVGDLPPAWGDPTAVEQVFANLIGNAVNYLDPARPGRIEVEALDPSTLAEGASVADLAVYAVRDNGLGIAEAYRSKIFTAFQRLHGDVAQGEGIGLTLVRRVVERHGGRVWFESEPGRGTSFFVALPSARDAPSSEIEGRPALATATAGATEPEGSAARWRPSP
jgi:signal transduction histidine kinase